MGATMKKGKQVFDKVSSQNSCKHYGDLEEYAWQVIKLLQGKIMNINKNQANMVKVLTKFMKVMNMAFFQVSNNKVPIPTLETEDDGCHK